MLRCWDGRRLIRNTIMEKQSVQNLTGRFAWNIMVSSNSVIFRYFLLAMPFCSGVFGQQIDGEYLLWLKTTRNHDLQILHLHHFERHREYRLYR